MIRHIQHAAHHAKRHIHRTYHKTKKALQHMDVYANMIRRVLVASQPMLEDMGVQESTFGAANEAFRRYDRTKENIERVDDAYTRLADAVQ